VNRIPVATPSRLLHEEREAVLEAMDRVLGHSQWILGPEVAEFETEYAAYIGARHVVGVGNGTDALALAFLALGLPQASDVLVTANDGGFSAVAARMVGLNPVVMDVDAVTLGPTAAGADAALTPDTSGIVITHLHGNAVDVAGLDEWRRAKGLRLIEDCAQAHGLRVDGRHVGATADAATFSFYPTKNLGAVGDGGAVAFTGEGAEALAGGVRALRQYGWDERRRVVTPGGRNSRLDEIQAAILRARLPFLETRNLRRVRIRDTYANALEGATRASILGQSQPSVAHHAVVLARSRDDRDDLVRHLDATGIDTAFHYPWLLQDMSGLRLTSAGSCPVARNLVETTVTVPCSPELREDEVARVADALEAWSAR
jgi:dTDP-3-amino-2,3,6-trideoxy-4-keto-D-glucose/dTDP-3-amino-3,4,6-trideoxy-alpha-D-glucose/dTDP-2,6-dideoxy-D-kanosamine transaminase